MSDLFSILNVNSLTSDELLELVNSLNYIHLPYGICECGGYLWRSHCEDLPEVKGFCDSCGQPDYYLWRELHPD